MTQSQINVLLAVLPILIPFVQFLLTKYFSQKKDGAEYGQDLLQIANDASEQLRKAREDITETEDRYEQVIKTIRAESEAAMTALRSESEAKLQALTNRIRELERVTRIYTIKFDLITHPNVEIKNTEVTKKDDVSASQKLRAITQEDINKTNQANPNK